MKFSRSNGARLAVVCVADIAEIDVIAPNFKRRLSGVTSTILQLVPFQASNGLRIAALAPNLPESVPQISWWSFSGLWRRPLSGRPFRIWHARRNIEMVVGIVLRDLLRAPLRLVFTSAAQRHHHPFTRWLLKRMDAVIATSERSGSYLEVPYTVIMHGIDLTKFPDPEAKFRDFDPTAPRLVGCFGRIRHQKGTDLFVSAMIRLLPKYPGWNAVIAGRTTPENRQFADALRAKIAEASLADRIRFLGEVSDITVWYRRISLYVAPSRNEGFGLTPLEAMASGCAVVASDAGAYAQLVDDGVTGAVVPAGDEAGLSDAIEKYFAKQQLVLEHGRNALDHVRKNFELSREADEIDAVYESLWSDARTAA